MTTQPDLLNASWAANASMRPDDGCDNAVKQAAGQDEVGRCVLAMHSSELLGQPAGPLRALHHLAIVRRGRTARLEADFLDRLVDAELEFIRRLPVHLRGKPAEALAVLVMLAQDHRYYAQGWISRRTLRRRAERAVADLDGLREATAGEQLP